jgi:tetratricopeptide (TPR) repeat protein
VSQNPNDNDRIIDQRGQSVGVQHNVVYIGISLADHTAALRTREQEIRAELAERIAAGDGKSHELEVELRTVQQKLSNTESSLAEHVSRLNETAAQIDALRAEFPEARIECALQALGRGDTHLAEAILEETENKADYQAAQAAYQRGKIAESVVRFVQALAHYERAADRQPSNAEFVNCAGFISHKIGDLENAERYYRAAAQLCVKGGQSTYTWFVVLINNAGLYLDLSRYDMALSYLQEALSFYSKEGHDDKVQLARIYNGFGGVYQRTNRLTESLSAFRQALRCRQEYLGDNHLDVATCLNNIGEVLSDMGEMTMSKEYHTKALHIRERALVSNHPDLAQSFNNIASLAYRAGDFSEAEKLYRKAIGIYESLSPNHPLVAVGLNNLANVFLANGDVSETLTTLATALDILLKVVGEHHDWTKLTRKNIETVTSLQRDTLHRSRRASTGCSKRLH